MLGRRILAHPLPLSSLLVRGTKIEKKRNVNKSEEREAERGSKRGEPYLREFEEASDELDVALELCGDGVPADCSYDHCSLCMYIYLVSEKKKKRDKRAQSKRSR